MILRLLSFTILLLLTTTSVFGQDITIGDDGIVRCKDVEIGTKQTIFGDEYEVVNRDSLIVRRDQGVDLSKMCVSNVTDMGYLFNNIDVNSDITKWDVSSVTNMEWMFRDSKFNQPIGSWDVSNVSNMRHMFVRSGFDQNIGNWDVSSVTDMSLMFWGESFNQDIGNWDVSSVRYMYLMFFNSQFNQNIGNWDVSSVTDMSEMFHRSQFNQDIGNWDVSSVTDMSEMFWGSPFNQDIGNWDVSSVTDMSRMFYSTDFNQDVGNWDVSSVTDMSSMFSENKVFNQDIGNWDVSSVTDMSRMFSENEVFNQDIGNWDVSSVTDMSRMFYSTDFNQDVGNWDVSSVTDMSFMFRITPFNKNISDWDVSSVDDMRGMFRYSQFNQDISNWCVPNISSEPVEFSDDSPLIDDYQPVWGTCPGIPPIPILLSPQNDTSGVFRQLELKWSQDSLSTIYQLQVFEGSESIIVDTLVMDTSFTNTEPFKSNTTYNWRVRGINGGEPRVSDWSSIYTFTTGELITSTESNTTPYSFSLNQNYPNPFNPTTTITYSLPQSGMVTLNVYDITGRFITTLVDGVKGVGTHSVQFEGSSLSSGMYVYTLETDGYRQTRQMMLVK